MNAKTLFIALVTLLTTWLSPNVRADQVCGDTGVWLQILGAGGPEIDDTQRGPSYLIWNDNKARVLIGTGPGSSVGFDQAEAKFEDLYAVAFTNLKAEHTADFPAYITGSSFADREEPLIILGPDSNNPTYPDTDTFVDRLIGPNGAYAYLADFLTHTSSGGYRVRVRNVPSIGKRRWARFGNEEVKLSAIPVNHGDVPAIAWRVDIGDVAVVITGNFNNLKNVMPEFAKDADALVFNHAIPENSRGTARDLDILPSQMGRIADQADARMVVLGHRMNRTRGRESQTRDHIAKAYSGYVLFANDGECWGL